jgi:integrase/recombinase XerD
VVRVQKIRVPDTGHLSWIVIDGGASSGRSGERVPCLSSSARKVAEHGQGVRTSFTVLLGFLVEQRHGWRDLKLTELAEFVSWVRHATRAGGAHRSDATINLILAAVGSFYEYQDRLGVETAISRSRRFGGKSPYKPFLHHISGDRRSDDQPGRTSFSDNCSGNRQIVE